MNKQNEEFIAQGCAMKEGGQCNCGPSCPCDHCSTHPKSSESNLPQTTTSQARRDIPPAGLSSGLNPSQVGGKYSTTTGSGTTAPNVCAKCDGPCHCNVDSSRQG